eukprot:8700698-Pyramimonas_sp.AAC.3
MRGRGKRGIGGGGGGGRGGGGGGAGGRGGGGGGGGAGRRGRGRCGRTRPGTRRYRLISCTGIGLAILATTTGKKTTGEGAPAARSCGGRRAQIAWE